MESRGKDIVWFDVETTGVNTSTDRIIQIYLHKTDSLGNHIDSFETYVNPQGVKSRPDAIEKHGITDEFLEDYPPFSHFADKIIEFIGDNNLGGYNIQKFDIPILMEELMRCGKVFSYRNRAIIDPLKILYTLEPRDLGSVYKRFTGKDLEGAHDAREDVVGTVEIFQSQRKYFGDQLPESIEELHDLINEDQKSQLDLAGMFKITEKEGEKSVIFGFGKYAKRPVNDVFQIEPGYFDWIANKSNFPTETKIICRKLTDRLKAGPINI